MATFLDELEEGVRTINRDLLALEKATAAERSEIILRLFRAAHSLKGAARAVRIKSVETACHGLETILSQVRDGGRTLDAAIVELLFAAADALGEAGRLLKAGSSEKAGRGLEGSLLAGLLPRIEAVASGAQTPEPRAVVAASVPASPPGDSVVRMRADKLDTLLARSSELLIARGLLDARTQEAQGLAESMNRIEAELKSLPKLMRRLLKEGKLRDGTAPVPGPGRGKASSWGPARRVDQTVVRTRDGVRKLTRDLERYAAGLSRDTRTLSLVAGSLEAQVRRLRMSPFSEVCEGLDRMVRDLAKQANKEVRLVIEGAEVELDRAVLGALKAPLLQLVRNAIDHGLETPEQRRAAGKSAGGTLTIAASLHSAQVHIVVKDDGRGLDLAAIRERLRDQARPEPAAERELVEAIFTPGFSTARMITDISGRGVGLDVVKSGLEALHGSVDVAWEPGRGTHFTMKVPLTLTMLRGLIVTVQRQELAFPSNNVHKLLRLGCEDLHTIEGWPTLVMEGRQVPVVSLADSLGMTAHGESPRIESRAPILIAAAGDTRVAFAVDELVEERELVVKSLGWRLGKLHNIAGAAILPTGKVAMVLHTAELVRSAMRNRSRERALRFEVRSAQNKKRLLVAEDTLTTRSLLQGLFEAAGYEVTLARDGEEAWELLQSRGADLLVSDVEMPRLDGFTLTSTIRASARFQRLPVVLVTGLENDRDKARGMQVGANAYLLKSVFDQRSLLETIAQLI